MSPRRTTSWSSTRKTADDRKGVLPSLPRSDKRRPVDRQESAVQVVFPIN